MLKNFSVALITITIFALGFFIASCADYQGEDPKEQEGGSYTEDVGLECDYPCVEDWCFKFNYPECLSKLCLGEADDQYCSNFCLNQLDCPSGYTCTELCEPEVQYKEEPYCVKDKDYELLKTLGYC